MLSANWSRSGTVLLYCREWGVEYDIVVGVRTMDNIVPRAGLGPAFLEFWASVIPLHHLGSLVSLLYLHPPMYVALSLRVQCRLLQYHGGCRLDPNVAEPSGHKSVPVLI